MCFPRWKRSLVFAAWVLLSALCARAQTAHAALPDISFPRRFPLPASLIVASLDEPVPHAHLMSSAAKIAATEPAKASAPKTTPKQSLKETPEPAAVGPSQPAARTAEASQASQPPAEKKPASAPRRSAAPVVDPIVEPVLPLAPPSTQEYVLPSAEGQTVVSRNVSAMVGERVEIPFDGSGWTYLGEKDQKEGVSYETRRFEGSGVVFVMNALQSGQYVLRFQRQDALRGLTELELIGVDVRNRPTVVAPLPSALASTQATSGAPVAATEASPGAVPSAAAAPPGTSAASTGTSAPPSETVAAPSAPAALPGGILPGAIDTSASGAAAALPPPDSPEGMLLAAKNELGAGRTQNALAILDKMLAKYPAGTDEAYYLYGTALEQNGPLQDIRRAYSYYKKVVDEYPESPFWDKANDRVSYIERYYFEIR